MLIPIKGKYKNHFREVLGQKEKMAELVVPDVCATSFRIITQIILFLPVALVSQVLSVSLLSVIQLFLYYLGNVPSPRSLSLWAKLLEIAPTLEAPGFAP